MATIERQINELNEAKQKFEKQLVEYEVSEEDNESIRDSDQLEIG